MFLQHFEMSKSWSGSKKYMKRSLIEEQGWLVKVILVKQIMV